MDDTELKAHEEVTKIKNVNRIQVGECWTAHKEMPTSVASTALELQTLACTTKRRGREREASKEGRGEEGVKGGK